jgi:hypothetical protein
MYYKKIMSHGTVSIATGYGLDDRGNGVHVPVGSRIFTSPYYPDQFWGPTKPPVKEIMCIRGLFSWY